MESIVKVLGITTMNPNGLFHYLQNSGLEVNPLGQGANKGIPFDEGEGYNAHFRTSYGESYIQYNPSSSHHEGTPYYKVSSGNVFEYTGVRTGTQRFFFEWTNSKGRINYELVY